MTMKVMQIEEDWSPDNIRMAERPRPEAGPGEVLIKMEAASLNYRDVVVARRGYGRRSGQLPLVPLSDGAGRVLSTGPGVTRVAVGDLVCPIFNQRWIAGPLKEEYWTGTLGGPHDGVMQEVLRLREDGLVRAPRHLDALEAATLPCAGVTAWNSLVAQGGIKAGDVVLVQGTGGVSLFALLFAKLHGARVIATSSSDAKLERLKALGASATVNYVRSPEWHKDVLQLTGGRGADCIVEVVGAGTLEQSFDAVAESGKVCLIGALKGRRAEISPYALMFKQATLHGVRVGSRDMFEQMNRAIAAGPIHPVIDRSFSFVDAIAAYHLLVSQTFLGKIVIAL
jgi:NADPH:quinone reductase-like Zn-dependent oxidoreductase